MSGHGLSVRLYGREAQEDWDAFVRSSKNGTFIFERAYMDYHADRFTDHSLVVRDHGGQLVALFPASRHGEIVASHAGLTYGGMVTDSSMTAPRMLSVFDAVTDRLRSDGMKVLRYKTVPHIYHRVPAEEDRYALFRAGAAVVRSDVLSAIDFRQRLPYQNRRRRALQKAAQAGLRVGVSTDLTSFWGVLVEALRARHDTAPVHDLQEMTLLSSRFPDRIVLHAAHRGEELIAGVVAYVTDTVCHLQYVATSEAGRAVGALDLVIDQAIDAYSSSRRWFDFGISTYADGRQLNSGLVEQKEGFGARTVTHDIFELDLRSVGGKDGG